MICSLFSPQTESSLRQTHAYSLISAYYEVLLSFAGGEGYRLTQEVMTK